MELTRIFHPVGQGGFYSEKLIEGEHEINVIYDCGGNSQTSIMNYVNDYYLSSFSKHIDALFISHLHDDHVNGLISLLKSRHVKYLILPQLNMDQILEMYLYNYIHDHTDANSLILELYDNNKEYYRESRIILVERSNGEDILEEEFNNQTDLDILNDSLPNMIKSGTKIHFAHEWFFIPYNPPANTKFSVGFFNFFKNKMNIVDPDFDKSPFEKLPSIVLKKGKNLCRDVYTEYFEKNHNAYSMALFSGTNRFFHYCDINNNYEMISCPFCEYHHAHYHRLYGPNCLYLGDFDIPSHIKALKAFYKPFWKTIVTIQIPHHGSRNNYDALLYNYPRKGIVSVGEHNRYHHPHIDTMIGIKRMRCEPIIVTENLSTTKIYHFKS